MQITIREKCHWEGETFNYILEVNEKQLEDIKQYAKEANDGKIPSNYWVLESEYTKEQVEELNEKSRNGYMSEYQFCSLPEGWSMETAGDQDFYKMGVLKNIK